ncbi:MEGF11 protein [Minicystis rosea]|nr:MEGF11 protein [Minicystis rosea]
MSIPVRTGLLALVAISILAAVPMACQSGGVGDPCSPEEEFDPQFVGFDIRQEYIESRSFQCSTRVCVVNHFQGRVSCPLGQTADSIKDCGGPGGAHEELCDTAAGEKCVESASLTVECDPKKPEMCASFGGVCDPDRRICVCGPDSAPPAGYHCSEANGITLPRTFVCHVPGSCQRPELDDADNQGKACCVPGTDTPVGTPVCGQCERKSKRDAAQAVYCSCRCGVADGQPEEPNFPFCTCPSGFSCSEIRPYLNISDPQLDGRYCIKEGTEYGGSPNQCGAVAGNHEAPCHGL